MFVSADATVPSFDNHKILIPCISVGNVGQLTLDLVINTLRLPRVGYLDHPAILPLVGNDAFDYTHPSSGHLHTAAEVYHSAEMNLVAVQFRTPLIKSQRGDFREKLLEWVKDVGISEVVVITSSQAHERRDSQITGEQFRFLLSSSACDLCTHFTEQFHWNALEPRSPPSWDQESAPPTSCPTPSEEKSGMLSDAQIFLPGSGLAKKLYKQCGMLGIRAIVMIGFCSQGDNIPDATAMACRLDSWIHLKKDREWIYPSSWSMMYGKPIPSNLF